VRTHALHNKMVVPSGLRSRDQASAKGRIESRMSPQARQCSGSVI
jgi:hypothetical protein